MGEVHYSRIPEAEWDAAIKKMKDGGVTVIATYVFWNHIEAEEGVFDWHGNRNLRKFIELCKANDMPVVLRIGPFCHGEVRNGGIPDWIFEQNIRSRSEDPAFLAAVERLYRQIFTQVQGLQWKDGGPVMACQFDNEFRGPASYLLTLKGIATKIGYDLPFYTRTGWPELSTARALRRDAPALWRLCRRRLGAFARADGQATITRLLISRNSVVRRRLPPSSSANKKKS